MWQHYCQNMKHFKVIWALLFTSLKHNWCRTTTGLINQMCQTESRSGHECVLVVIANTVSSQHLMLTKSPPRPPFFVLQISWKDFPWTSLLKSQKQLQLPTVVCHFNDVILQHLRISIWDAFLSEFLFYLFLYLVALTGHLPVYCF